MKLSIVVPCYNEGENIPLLLDAYAKVITRSDVEIILVNNGSTDSTGTLLEEIAPKYEQFLKVVTVPVNQGYGYGILTGLRAAEGEFIGWTHGDMQTPPKDILTALTIIEEQSNNNIYVKGKRTGRPLFDHFFTLGMSVFETIYLKTPLFDINAQPNIFHRSFFATWENPPSDFSLDLYALYMARQQKLNLIRFTVPFLKRVHGSSKWNTGILSRWKFIKRTITFSKSLKKQLTP